MHNRTRKKLEKAIKWYRDHPKSTIRECHAAGFSEMVCRQAGRLVSGKAEPELIQAFANQKGTVLQEYGSAPVPRAGISFTPGLNTQGISMEQLEQEVIATLNNPDIAAHSRIQAIRELRTLKAQGAGRELGPGLPLTDEQKVERLSLLMQACGQDIVKSALAQSGLEELVESTSVDTDGHSEPSGTTEGDTCPAELGEA